MGKRTPLYEIHKICHGSMVEFAGWEMPVYYAGIIQEHCSVRRSVGLFDVSHMGRIEVSAKDSLANLQKLLVGNINALSISQVKYSALCNPKGGVVDDVTVYRLSADRFLLCVNASNTEKDYRWIMENAEGEVNVIDRSSELAQLAVQGPKSFELLQELTPLCLTEIGYYRFSMGTIDGIEAMISRTGYTGETGFELYFPAEFAVRIWERLMAEGKRFGLQPVGLGARDTLRLEAALPLYGHELDESTTLLEAGLDRFIDFDKPHFIGKDKLVQQNMKGVRRKLIGFRMIKEGIPRSQYKITRNGDELGEVTSGTMSPTMRIGIGLGYIRTEDAWTGNEISIMIRNKKHPAIIVKLPFYTRRRE